MPTHTTLTGHEISYDEPSPELAKLLRKLDRLAADPKASEDDMILLMYAETNPLLEAGVIPGRGMVTKATLERPEYYVMGDLLDRKRLQQSGTDPEELAREYTLSVGDVARQLGVHESAVRQAIAARRLGSWLRDGRHYLHPRAVESFGATMHLRAGAAAASGAKRAKPPGTGRALKVRMGTVEGAGLHVKSDGSWVAKGDPGCGEVHGWRHAAVISGKGEKQRLFLIEPSSEQYDIGYEGFFVRGYFRVVTKENNAKRAVDAWKAWPKGAPDA